MKRSGKANILLVLLTSLLVASCSGGDETFDETSSTQESTENTNLGSNQNSSQSAHQALSPYTYQGMLKTGMDVDWVKTDQGRVAAQTSHDNGINVPKLFKERGLSHVRIRVKEDIRDDSTDLTGKTLLQELTNMVDDSIEAGLIPVIAYQAKPFKLDPTDDEILNDVVEWWKTAAEHFKDYPYTVAYDLIIETTNEVKKHNDRLNLLYQKATVAIREIDPKRIIIVAPNKISNPYELDNLIVPEPHDYMMVEWHFYAAGPSPDNPKKLWTTGTDEEKQLVLDRINHAKEWSDNNGIPTWVGAWRANRYPKGTPTETLYDGAPGGGDYDIDEQRNIATFISEALQDADIPYAINSDTKFFNRDTNEWYQSMADILDAMIKRY